MEAVSADMKRGACETRTTKSRPVSRLGRIPVGRGAAPLRMSSGPPGATTQARLVVRSIDETELPTRPSRAPIGLQISR